MCSGLHPRLLSRSFGSLLMRTRIPGLTLLILIANVTTAQAFEADGFRAGMSEGEAQAVARSAGFYLTKPRREKWLVMESSADKDQKFAFCRDRLFAYSKSLPDLAAFVRVLSAQTSRLGRAEYEASGYDGMESRSSVQSVVFGWRAESDEQVSLKAMQIDWKSYFSIIFSSRNDCELL